MPIPAREQIPNCVRRDFPRKVWVTVLVICCVFYFKCAVSINIIEKKEKSICSENEHKNQFVLEYSRVSTSHI